MLLPLVDGAKISMVSKTISSQVFNYQPSFSIIYILLSLLSQQKGNPNSNLMPYKGWIFHPIKGQSIQDNPLSMYLLFWLTISIKQRIRIKKRKSFLWLADNLNHRCDYTPLPTQLDHGTSID